MGKKFCHVPFTMYNLQMNVMAMWRSGKEITIMNVMTHAGWSRKEIPIMNVMTHAVFNMMYLLLCVLRAPKAGDVGVLARDARRKATLSK